MRLGAWSRLEVFLFGASVFYTRLVDLSRDSLLHQRMRPAPLITGVDGSVDS